MRKKKKKKKRRRLGLGNDFVCDLKRQLYVFNGLVMIINLEETIYTVKGFLK